MGFSENEYVTVRCGAPFIRKAAREGIRPGQGMGTGRGRSWGQQKRGGVMEALNKSMTGKKDRPVKVVQFGEGNFLRAFVDYMIDIANEKGEFNGDIVLVKPITFGTLERFHEQDCQYTVQLRGIVDDKPQRINRIVTSVADAVDAYEEYEKRTEGRKEHHDAKRRKGIRSGTRN